ncbi:MAG: hypothetical protein ACRDWT_06125 [Jatrophihabitantaceae bacterium]
MPGSGHLAGSRSPDFPSASTNRAPASSYARAPVSTRIGDPATHDLCDLVDFGSLDTLALSVSMAEPQYQPGCDLEIAQDDGGASIYVELTAEQRSPSLRGATRRLAATLAAYTFGYDTKGGDCERVVAAGADLWLEMHAFPDSDNAFPARTTCSEMDKLAAEVAASVIGHEIQPWLLPTPSLSSLEFCHALSAVGREDVPLLDGTSATDLSFGVRCELNSAAVRFYIQYAIADEDAPADSTPISVDGHRLFAASGNDDGYAVFTSVQQALQDGAQYEEIEAGAIAVDAGHPPADLQTQTAQVLAEFLDTVNLH